MDMRSAPTRSCEVRVWHAPRGQNTIRAKRAGVVDVDGEATSERLLVGLILNHLVNVLAVLAAESGGKGENNSAISVTCSIRTRIRQ